MDRLGANLIFMISQLIVASEKGLYIKADISNLPCAQDGHPCNYIIFYSIFLKTLLVIIDGHNASLTGEIQPKMTYKLDDLHYALCECVIMSKSDIFSYFFNKFPQANKILNKFASEVGYKLPFDPSKTIIVHLRLDDCRDGVDYDGRTCSEYVYSKINKGEHVLEYEIKYPFNGQSPIPKDRIQAIINTALERNPGRKVILITSPGENLSEWDYETISTSDPSYDLFLMACSEVFIASRSTYSLCAILFGKQKDIYVPEWGHASLTGLKTIYQKVNFNFFY